MIDSGGPVGEGNGTLLGPLGRSQTRVPGLALSCPYHCTSASSEHRGLLRKQLSLKDLYEKTRIQVTSEKNFISKSKLNKPSADVLVKKWSLLQHVQHMVFY